MQESQPLTSEILIFQEGIDYQIIMNDQKITKIIEWLGRRRDSTQAYSFLKEFITSENASEIIRLWLDQGFPVGMNQDDRACELMSELENFADEIPNEALLLMTALHPIASQLYLHDVCDAIGLWQHELG